MFCAYLEQNTVNGKFYAGKGPWKTRHQNRKYEAGNPKNPNHNFRIQRAYRKYGEDVFVPHTICFFDTEEAAFGQEKTWIKELDLMNPEKGYNLTLGGDGCMGRASTKRGKHIPVPHLNTPEVREKARIAVIKSGGHKLTVCRRGHDRTNGGTFPNGQCRKCEKISAQKKKEKLAPILASLGIGRNKYYEMKRKGLLGE